MKLALRVGFGVLTICGSLGYVVANPEMRVVDTQGRTIEIELISADEKTVTFRRKGNAREFTLTLDQLDAESRTRIAEEAKALPTVLPRIEPVVVIGKRRDKGSSYYMVKQTVSCTVKLRNPDTILPLPKLNGRVIFYGQNQKMPDAFRVLSVQDFPVQLQPGESASTELKDFITIYDSDNKGEGNIGGYQYAGYLLVFLAEEGEVLFDQTTDAKTRQALAGRPDLLRAFSNYSVGSGFDAKLAPFAPNLLPPPYTQH